MSAIDEMVAFLNSRLRESETKGRNIDMIAYYYGFRDSSWPTLEEAAAHGDVGTRERARQIITENFRDVVKSADMPSMNQLREVVEGKEYWLYSELAERIAESNLVGDIFNIQCLFNLMKDLKIDIDYAIYTPHLEQATKASLHKFEESFVIKESYVSQVKPLLSKAWKAPGLRGIYKFEYLEQENEAYKVHRNLITNMLRHSRSAWTREVDGDMWYLFEDRENTLINKSRKVFSVFDECNADRLAEAYSNALRRRDNKYAFPSAELISDYLKNSVYFENVNGNLQFTGQTDDELSEIESDVIEYLNSHPIAKSPEIRSFLSGRGHTGANITKATFNSPFVYVDKSTGRHNYVFSLVGAYAKPSASESAPDGRYMTFFRRLRQLGNTDEPAESKVRKEQSILRQWLFEGKSQSECAICGNSYSVNALVAAHKKKRTECNEAERLNPYIVMPACLFGCDFLYEKQHIFIDNGVVQEGLLLDHEGIESNYVKSLIGRKVSDEWLNGQLSYFQKP